MPFGGMKESGIGREGKILLINLSFNNVVKLFIWMMLGTTHSLELYTEETTICYKFDWGWMNISRLYAIFCSFDVDGKLLHAIKLLRLGYYWMAYFFLLEFIKWESIQFW